MYTYVQVVSRVDLELGPPGRVRSDTGRQLPGVSGWSSVRQIAWAHGPLHSCPLTLCSGHRLHQKALHPIVHDTPRSISYLYDHRHRDFGTTLFSIGSINFVTIKCLVSTFRCSSSRPVSSRHLSLLDSDRDRDSFDPPRPAVLLIPVVDTTRYSTASRYASQRERSLVVDRRRIIPFTTLSPPLCSLLARAIRRRKSSTYRSLGPALLP